MTRQLHKPHDPVSLTLSSDQVRQVLRMCNIAVALSRSIAAGMKHPDARRVQEATTERFDAIRTELLRQYES